MLIFCRRCAGKGRIARFGHLSNNGACLACEGTGKTSRRNGPTPAPDGVEAFIRVDTEDFMRLFSKENTYEMFDETVRRVGGHVSLHEWSPRFRCYVPVRFSITAPVKDGPNV